MQLGISGFDPRQQPDGMPGDYTVAAESGVAYMESFGAGTIEVRAGDEVLQLREGTKAEILIPVDPGLIVAGSKIPATVPLLQYESKSGAWQSIGAAKLDERLQAFVASVGHFSEFNADVVKTDPDGGAGCSELNPVNFVQLDSITIVGMNSSNQLAAYRINNADVCVDVAGSVITTNYPDPANPPGPLRKVDAIIGSNLFDRARILWDGPHRNLGILP